MTTHELAGMLSHFRDAFGPNLKTDAAKAMTEAAEAFQSLPEKPLRDLVKDLQKSNAGPDALVQQILEAKAGHGASDTLLKTINKLKGADLKPLLGALHLPTTGKVADQRTSLLAFINGAAAAPESNGDHEAIESAHRLYQQLASSNNTIEELRARFQPLADARKPVLVGIAAKLGYRTDATREEIAERLLQTLEGLNVSRVRNELIGAAT
jgi:hypothetical protein